MSKKKDINLSKFEETYFSIRKEWNIKPITKIFNNKKKYNRKRNNKNEY